MLIFFAENVVEGGGRCKALVLFVISDIVRIMPTIFRQGGFRFFFYSNEGDPREPVHVHAVSADGEAKFWVGAEVELARSAGLNSKTLRKLVQIVVERQEDISGAWYDHFG